MRIYPDSYEDLGLTEEELAFLRWAQGAFPGLEPACCAAGINPRKKQGERFHLLVLPRGALLLRFFPVDSPASAAATLGLLEGGGVCAALRADLEARLAASGHLTDSAGQLNCALGVLLVFPRVEAAAVTGLLSEAQRCFCGESVLFGDQLARLETEGPGALLDRLPQGEPLDAVRADRVFQRLCPELSVLTAAGPSAGDCPPLADPPMEPGDEVAEAFRLSGEQVALVNRLAPGDQLVLSCTGGGKDKLLLAKCLHLARANPDRRFLFTCYGRNQNQYARWAVAQTGYSGRNVVCASFHGLCRQLLSAGGLTVPQPEGQEDDYYDRLVQAAEIALASGGLQERFAGVFIDNVQFFQPAWYRFCCGLLESRAPASHILVAADDLNRKVRCTIESGSAPWQGDGGDCPDCRGRTLQLESNYRNSGPILAAAQGLLEKSERFLENLGVDRQPEQRLSLGGRAARPGTPPRLAELQKMSNEGEAEAIGDAVARLMEERGLGESDIAVVLYNRYVPYITLGWATQEYDLLPGLQTYFTRQGWEPPTLLYHGEEEGATYGSRRGVTVVSIEGAAGLEFRGVVLAGLRPMGLYERAVRYNDLWYADGEELARRVSGFRKNIDLLYSAMTCARDELTVVLSASRGQSVYLDLLRQVVEETE